MRLIMSKLHSGTFFARSRSLHWPQDRDTQTDVISQRDAKCDWEGEGKNIEESGGEQSTWRSLIYRIYLEPSHFTFVLFARCFTFSLAEWAFVHNRDTVSRALATVRTLR